MFEIQIVTVTSKLAEIPELGTAQTSQGSHQLGDSFFL